MKCDEVISCDLIPWLYFHLCNMGSEYPCPYCEDWHKAKEVESNEDVFYVYMDCPKAGEVRLTFEFQNRFERVKNDEE